MIRSTHSLLVVVLALGGLLGYHAANDFSATFGIVAALSSSFWLGTTENISRAGRDPSTRARLYIDSGTAGTSADSYWDTVAVRDALLASGHVYGPKFLHAFGPGDQHNEAAWRRRSPDVLRWMWAPELTRIAPADASGWQVTTRR